MIKIQKPHLNVYMNDYGSTPMNNDSLSGPNIEGARPYCPFDIHCYTVTSAIALIKTGLVNHISLDFDMDFDDGLDGMDVVTTIVALAASGQIEMPSWDINSNNPEGGNLMDAAMKAGQGACEILRKRSMPSIGR